MTLELRNNIPRITYGALVCLLFVVGIACNGQSKPARPDSINMDFVGTWTSPDETTLVIRADGSCDYRSESETVNGAVMKFDKANGRVSFSDPEKWRTLEVDKAVNQLKLDGIVFRKAPGGEEETKKPQS